MQLETWCGKSIRFALTMMLFQFAIHKRCHEAEPKLTNRPLLTLDRVLKEICGSRGEPGVDMAQETHFCLLLRVGSRPTLGLGCWRMRV